MKTKSLLLLALTAAAKLHAQGVPPVVTLQQSPIVAHPLQAVILNASVTGAPAGTAFTYKWKRGGLALPGATLPNHVIPRILSRDLGTYECEIVATHGQTVRTLTASIECTCDYPETVTIVETTTDVSVIGTDGDDDVEITRLGHQVKVAVTAAGNNPSSEYRIDTFTCCGVGSGRITVDLGDGMDFLECDVATGVSIVASAELLGGGQPGDVAIMTDLSGFPNPQVEGFETVSTGSAITGHLASSAMPAGQSVNPDHLTPLTRAAITFSIEGGTQSPWTARFVSNDSGRFLGVLPPLPQGMTTASLVAQVEESTLTWSALSGGSLVPFSTSSGPSKIGLGLGVRPHGPCAPLPPPFQYPSLLIPFDESAHDATSGTVCTNIMDTTNPATSSSPSVIPGYVNRGRAFVGGVIGTTYQVANPAPVNPGTGDFSFSCWLLPSIHYGPSIPANQVILDHTDAAGTSGWKFGIVGNQPYLAMGAGILSVFNAPGAVPYDNAWHLVSVSVDAGNNVTFYIDGASAGVPVSAIGTPNLDNAMPLRIGPGYFGSLDELEFSNYRAISASDVYALWLAGSFGRCLDPRPAKRVLHFGMGTEFTIAAASFTDPVVIASLRDPLADSDADGSPNRLEYSFGTDPLLAQDTPQISHAFTTQLTLTARRRATRTAVENVVAEFTTDMLQWTPGTLLSSQPQPDGTVLETWGDPAAASAPRRLGRLTETPAP